MIELLNAALSWTTLPFTILLGVVVLYWAIVIIGVIDVEFLDGMLDFDTDMDIDADFDADADGAHGGIFNTLFSVFHFVDVPVMIPISFFVISLWLISVLGNFYLNPTATWWIAGLILIGNIFVSGIVMRTFSKPIAKAFKKMNADDTVPTQIVGSLCHLTMNLSAGRIGQAELDAKGASVLLTVTFEEGPDLNKGDEVVVTKFNKERNVYTIKPLNLED